MLNPRLITDAIVAALQTIPELVTAMAGDASRIVAYHYLFGADNRLDLAVNVMPAPSILVAFEATQPGNFSGSEIWRHHFQIYIRTGSAANFALPLSYEDIWFYIVNGKVNGTSQNIRYINLIDEVDIMLTPGIIRSVDEDRVDTFVASFVIPEIGDN